MQWILRISCSDYCTCNDRKDRIIFVALIMKTIEQKSDFDCTLCLFCVDEIETINPYHVFYHSHTEEIIILVRTIYVINIALPGSL